ncbi:MAG: flagellar export chaperone FliS [Kofleriaceae bacterium]
MNARAANIYKRVDLDSAPKTQILERLFDRFERDLEVARTAIKAKDIHGKAAALDHALRIVGELVASLDHAAAPELCANLDALYRYVMEQIGEANTKLAIEPLAHASRVMTDLADSFKQAHK